MLLSHFSTGLRRIVTNTGWLVADRLLRMGVGLFVGVWVARYLGPARFGALSYAGSFVYLFSAVATLGLDGVVIRELVRKPEMRDELLGTSCLLKLAGGCCALLVSVVAIALVRLGDGGMQVMVAVIAAGFVFQSLDVVDFWFQSKTCSKYVVYARNAAFIVTSLCKVGLIICEAPLVAFAWIATLEVALGAAGLMITYRKIEGVPQYWRVSFPLARRLMADCWPLIFSGVIIMIYMRIDQVMLGEMSTSTEVGVYAAAVRIAEVWYFIPMAVVSSVFPSVVAARESSDELFYARLQRLYNLMALVSYCVALPTMFLAGPLIQFLFGAAYAAAAQQLALLVWAGLFTSLGVARSTFLTAMNWTRIHLLTVTLGGILNVLLNLVLIPRYGGMGAVVASIVAYWFAAHGSCFLYPPLFKTGRMLTRAMLLPKPW